MEMKHYSRLIWGLTRCPIRLLIAILLCCCLNYVVCAGDGNSNERSKLVVASLDAKWQSTPLLLEIGEFLAEEKQEYFWTYIDRITNLTPEFLYKGTDKDHYELILSEVSHIISQERMNLLKFSLSLRSYSPLIELFQQIALTKDLPARCSAVIEVNSKFTCDLMDLETLLETASERNRSDIYKLDHQFTDNQAVSIDAVLVVLYGELGTSAFREFHFILKEQARQRGFTYMIRHYLTNRAKDKVRLSGYGVELAIKSTEYKAVDDSVVKSGDDLSTATTRSDGDEIDELEGFVFSRLKVLYPDEASALDRLREALLGDTQDLAPLKVWQLKDLGMQAAQRIMSSPTEEALWVMRDIAQNFPLQARSLVKTVVNANLSKEAVNNQNIFAHHLSLSQSDTALFVNGIFFDPGITDIYTLLDALKEDFRLSEEIHRIGVKGPQMEKILSLDFSVSQKDYAVDIRDSAVRYLNDLENDKAYSSWLPSINDILRPTYPGLLRSIRKNIFHLVGIVDPSAAECRELLKLLESFYVHRAPIRIGLAFAVNADPSADGFTDAGIAMLNVFNFVAEERGSLYSGLSFLTDIYAKVGDSSAKISSKDVIDVFRGEFPREDLDLIFGLDSDYDTGRKLAWEYLHKTGLKGSPEILINGVRLPKDKLNGDDFEEAVLSEIMEQTLVVQKAVYKGELSDSDDVLDFLMQRENVVQRLNERILNSSWHLIDVTGRPVINVSPTTFVEMSSSDKTATIIADMPYLTDRDDFSFRPITIWVVTDFASKDGRQLLVDALEQMRMSNDLRVGIVHNPSAVDDRQLRLITDGVEFALRSLPKKRGRLFIQKLIKEMDSVLAGSKLPVDFLDQEGEKEAYEFWQKQPRPDILAVHSIYCKDVLHFERGRLGLVVNGRILGPLDDMESFNAEDFNLLERHSLKTFGDKVRNVFEDDNDLVERDTMSDLAFRVSALILGRKNVRTRHQVKHHGADHSVVKLPPRDPDRPSFNITVIVDPVSRGAQKISHLLIVLQEVLNCRIWIFLSPQSKLSDMPLKSFYRFVLQPEIKFASDGKLIAGPSATFHKVPSKPLFTLNLDTPENWLVEVVRSPYDLDNIHLEEADGTVFGEYELEHLLIEGHCFDQASGTPPRGLQFILGTAKNPDVVDTIVMANLGYFQLKASPGAWFLKFRKGRSADIYEIASHEGTNSPPDSPDVQILVGNFRSKIVKIRVAKKPDNRHLDVLEDDEEDGKGIWNSITSTFSSKSAKESDDDSGEDVINIFSLASGHLYERLLRIMMLSVLKHTQTKVKFWFLKNYLSPTFKDILPEMASHYGFEYELVQYKWPRWLHQQTEKQRIIWGYKILFLDVLFPLSVKKFIFVDADQVVRADMKELRDLDLGGSPYGYTPFCESRKDMDGYRFWKSGYWASHLQGRRYHISALYVVDLRKFRRIAAGDRLRGQYQGLSQDPNSLSNLDQDLPNNMIHQVSIKSLPQEWLWCETWCDEATKSKAKTIDLCNNPMTKESKLSSAMRIIPEWKSYDDEIRVLVEDFLAKRNSSGGDILGISDKEGKQSHEHLEL